MVWRLVYFNKDGLMIFDKGLVGCGHGFPQRPTMGTRQQYAVQAGVKVLVSQWYEHMSPNEAPA